MEIVSRKIKVKQSLETVNFNIMYSYEHDEGVRPEMITSQATAVSTETNPSNLRVDVTYYPSTKNLQVTCHNKPDGFDTVLINEIVVPIHDLLAGFAAPA